jgi:DNA-binding response OmpR family regulator
MHDLIAIIAGDEELAHRLELVLRRDDRRVVRAAVAALEQEPADLIVVEVSSHDRAGLDVCRHVRAASRTRRVPIVACGALDTWADQLEVFEAGADSYFTTPLDARKLNARVDDLLRRTRAGGHAPGAVTAGALRIDPTKPGAWIGEAPLDLTVVEYRVLAILVACGGQLIPTSMLLDEVRGVDARATARSIAQAIASLRMKLGHLGAHLETSPDGEHRFAPGSRPRGG